ncbi:MULTISPECIES: cyclic peptide export ABC transporter [Thiorhodovibrio]|uniref:cyclic peptide export ABC transporter n=1 Tax=Thiorhodovibrio TaxID=61593 RepID=UPI001912C711|nr:MULTISPECIES: cyclic peptide export ABC transporter [Thiorhodovibrio]
MIYLIASDAEQLARQELDIPDLMSFLLALSLFGVVFVVQLRQATRVSDHVVTRIALRLARSLRAASLPTLETVGPDRIITAVTRDLTTIGGALPLAFSALQTGVMIAVCILLIAATNLTVLLVSGLLLSTILWLVRRNHLRMRLASAAAAEAEGRFCSYLEHALLGFRELRINHAKRHDFYARYLLPQVEEASVRRLEAGAYFVRQMQLSHGTWFVLVGAAAFVAPALGVAEGVTTAVLILTFLRTPMVDMATYLPSLLNARLALERYEDLEAALDTAQGPWPDESGMESSLAQTAQPEPPPTFDHLSLRQLAYEYYDPAGAPLFRVGPIDVTLKSGEVVLVSGGNGSGKTTFLKLLTGLYPPASGRLMLDDHPLSPHQARALFSTVFTDFHLFQRLYGIEEIDPEETGSLLRTLDLTHKVLIRDRAFSTTALSTGQRRRLALIAALLERRPILLFDEWTADQDPEFRRFFYQELLPQLKAQGKTIIAVTHDQTPVACADRHWRLQDGRLEEMPRGSHVM